MDRTAAQPKVNLILLRSNSLKFQPLYSNEVYIITDSSESKMHVTALRLLSPHRTVYNMEPLWMLTEKDVNTCCGTV